MTGMAYEQAPMPDGAFISSFNLKSWSPFKPAPLESRMRYEPPTLDAWTTSRPYPPAFGLGSESQSGSLPELPDLVSSDIVHGADVEEVEQKEPPNLKVATALLNRPEREGLRELQVKQEHPNSSPLSKPRTEPAISPRLKDDVVRDTDTTTNRDDRGSDLSLADGIVQQWTQELEHQNPRDTQALSETILTATQGLLNMAARTDNASNGKAVLSLLRSWLRTPRTSSILTTSHLTLVLDHAPGKGDVPADLAQARPMQHKIFSDLCLLFLDTAANDEALVPEILKSPSLMRSIMHALAKCDDAEISCRIAADFCEKITSTPSLGKLSSVFLQEYCFLNSRAGPFQNGISIRRCLPLAGFLKGFARDSWMQRNISRVTIHRYENHTVTDSTQHATPLDYWLKTTRLSGIKLAKNDRSFIVKAISMLNQAQLLADCIEPLTKAEACAALMEAWVPLNEISPRARWIFHQRQKTFALGKSQYTGQDPKEWYWSQETPFVNLVSGLREISPTLTQEFLPRILHVLCCLEDFGAVSQIANYMVSKNTPIPYHMLLAILQPLHSKQPILTSRIIYRDPRPFALLNPEILTSMILGGTPKTRIHYIIQSVMGLANSVKFNKVPPASAVTITKQHTEMLCRAADAFTKLPGLKAGVPISHISLPVRYKFHHIIRIIALFVHQPEAMDERLVRSLYHVAVSEVIDISETTSQNMPVSAWRLAVANKIATMFGYHEMRKFFTAQAMEHDRRIDMPDLEERAEMYESCDQDTSAPRMDDILVNMMEEARAKQSDNPSDAEGINTRADDDHEKLEMPAESEEQKLADYVSNQLGRRRREPDMSWDAEPIGGEREDSSEPEAGLFARGEW